MPSLRSVLLVLIRMAAVRPEDDAALDRIPRAFVDDEHGRMRCDGDRCAALVGEIGVSTSCAVYAARPDVCRVCLPGDDACQLARLRFNLA
jgi:hypothetical protein